MSRTSPTTPITFVLEPVAARTGRIRREPPLRALLVASLVSGALGLAALQVADTTPAVTQGRAPVAATGALALPEPLAPAAPATPATPVPVPTTSTTAAPPPPTTVAAPTPTTATPPPPPPTTAPAAAAAPRPAPAPPTPPADPQAMVDDAFRRAVPAAWRAAVPARISVIDGSTSWASTDGTIKVALSHVTRGDEVLRVTLAHEFGHLIAFRYGTQAFLGAAPADWPAYSTNPAEAWADCVARVFTGSPLPSHGLPPCGGASLSFASSWLQAGPAAHLVTR